ncbi:hypothetical protein CEUSTIGMA_g12735.t1 [Chlamydomonas eustigma]|uniref:Thioredoxin domain-containing protein n=1 Tax=Chlamydomonas eustigma TaxID=1157962 RepID=A0A250XQI3_9CHLO|nr:hypothetical protein CEUSTIGMA_g12735.t1 [Chlamydomonas eustigma]|eukprot:GAX85318.1 hypothetical protein CEUSTIGMA_g12735.t1 [Chlamydomonas eustigma]
MAEDRSSQISLHHCLGDSLQIKKEGRPATVSTSSVVDGKYVGLYFSAHWCPPCRGFTPRLRQTYEGLLKEGKPFEVVFVSLDRSQQQFDEYYGEMPWAALPFDSNIKKTLASKFGVASIPTFVMISPEGHVLSKNAKSSVTNNPKGFPWEGEDDPSGAPGGGSNMRWIVWAFLVFYVVYTLFFRQGR